MGLRLSSFPDAGLLDGTELVGLVQKGQTVKARVDDIAIIAKGPPGSPGEGYPTRAALSDVIALARDDAYLTEPGREGKFVFDDTDFATQFGASLAVVDPAQGIYVPPASDPTGASGAWVRKNTGAINPRWFGISDTNTAAANSSAFTALKTALKATASLSGDYGSLPRVSFPDDKTYNFASTLDIDEGTMILSADVLASPTTGATIKTPAGVTAIRLQRYNTSGASASTGTGTGGDSSIIERLRIIGGYAGTEGEFHGIHIRAHGAKVRDCYISGFEGDGVHIDSSNGGNCNNNEVTSNIIGGCRNGIFLTGGDANICDTRNNDVSGNRRWGILDDSFLGNRHQFTAEGCGLVIGTTPTVVSYLGNRYACVAGQEAGASTNAPSGTTADNTWWYYNGAGGPDTTTANVETWTSGHTYRSGGPARTNSNSAENIIVPGCWAEVGQGPCQFVWPTLVIGGSHLLSGIKGVSWLRHDDTGLRIEGQFNLGTAFAYSNGTLIAQAANAFQFNDAEPPTSIWTINNSGGTLIVASNQNVGGNFYSAGALTFSFDSTGINLASGKALKVAGSTVLTDTALSLGTLTVATLPASPAVGTKAFVTDANAATFGTVVAGGGANKVPVYYDGAWKIG